MNLISKFRQRVSRRYRCWIPQFDATRSIFVHVPKAAGTSIALALYGKDPWHHPLIDYDFLSTADFRHYFKFAFVRNPYDRLLSSYLYSFKQVVANPSTSVKFVTKYETFEHFVLDWITAANAEKHYFFYPQVRYIASPRSRFPIDFVGRYESLQDDFSFVCQQLGVRLYLPKTNTSSHEHFSNYYTGNMIDAVREVYDQDFTALGYNKDPLIDC